MFLYSLGVNMVFILNALFVVTTGIGFLILRRILTNRLPKNIAAHSEIDLSKPDKRLLISMLNLSLTGLLITANLFIIIGLQYLAYFLSEDYLRNPFPQFVFIVWLLVSIFSVVLAQLTLLAPELLKFTNKVGLTNLRPEIIDQLLNKTASLL